MDRHGKLTELIGGYINTADRPTITYTVGEGWMLVEDWTVQIDHCEVEVPAGFRFDLSSVPRLFWGLIAPFDLSIEAPLTHDALYRNHSLGGRRWRRREVDRLFRLIQKRERVCAWRRVSSWLAVRLFGFWAWRQGPKKAG